jgi:PAS domain S-box-containing protein
MTAMDLEIHDLRARLEAAQESLAALRGGDVDAFVVHDHDGEKIYTLHTADRPFRLFLERMKQGAVALSPDGIILYCNNQFADLIGAPLTELLGRYLHAFVAPHSRGALVMLLRLAEQRTAEAEIDLVARDAVGITICTLISASMLDADDGNTVCLVVTDLTEQKYHENWSPLRVLQTLKRIPNDVRAAGVGRRSERPPGVFSGQRALRHVQYSRGS